CAELRGAARSCAELRVAGTGQRGALRAALGKIIDKEIHPFVDKWEEEGQFPAHKVFKILKQAGFLGVDKPTEYSSMGFDFSYNIAVAEELGNIQCAGIPLVTGVQVGMSIPALTRFGSDELKKKFPAPTIAGDFVASLGIGEVGTGSAAASINTTAERKDNEYIINGGKMWITSGSQANMCLLANTGKGPPHRNKCLICLPMNLPVIAVIDDKFEGNDCQLLLPAEPKGVQRSQWRPQQEPDSSTGILDTGIMSNRPLHSIHITKKIDKLGMRSSDTADVRVPSKNLTGEEGMGFTYQMLQFHEERLWGVATARENIIQETIDYTCQRKAFGQPVLHNQMVHFCLAELATEVELLTLLYRTLALYQGNSVTKFASMTKLKADCLAREVTDSCLQFWGGMGFSSEILVSRFYSYLRLTSIGGGTDETMLSIICKYMETFPKK
ncbi:LOW QUALITY PROTEIN: putative acyl-CoA dehydrogenase 6, partial [Eudromia elegans]